MGEGAGAKHGLESHYSSASCRDGDGRGLQEPGWDRLRGAKSGEGKEQGESCANGPACIIRAHRGGPGQPGPSYPSRGWGESGLQGSQEKGQGVDRAAARAVAEWSPGLSRVVSHLTQEASRGSGRQRMGHKRPFERTGSPLPGTGAAASLSHPHRAGPEPALSKQRP